MTTQPKICQFDEDGAKCEAAAEYRQMASGEQEGFWCAKHTVTIGARWFEIYGDSSPKYERLSDGVVHSVRVRAK